MSVCVRACMCMRACVRVCSFGYFAQKVGMLLKIVWGPGPPTPPSPGSYALDIAIYTYIKILVYSYIACYTSALNTVTALLE